MERGKRIEERPRPLSAVFVKSVKHPGRYSDGPGGHGLSLLVKPGWRGRMAKSWSQRLRINGKAFNVGLGSYPVITLARARELALHNRQAVAEGNDPRTPPDAVPTFAEAVDKVIAERSTSWKNLKTAKRWRARMDTYAIPTLGDKPVTEITTADVIAVLSPIWVEKPETGRQVRENTSVIMEWVIGQNHRSDNPASQAILKSLPKQSQRVKHFRALPHGEVGPAIEKVRDTDGEPTTKLAFEYIAYTATRSVEARLATWDEVNLENRTWTVPASRMKNSLEHKVPLSEAALECAAPGTEIRQRQRADLPFQEWKTHVGQHHLQAVARKSDRYHSPRPEVQFPGLGGGMHGCSPGDCGVRPGPRDGFGGGTGVPAHRLL